MENYLNIREFGAKGDGVSDDTGALLAAMARVAETGGAVYFPAGVYSVSPVKVPSHITLCGESAWGYDNRTAAGIAAWGRAYRDFDDRQGLDPDYLGNTVLAARSADGRALLDLDGSCGVRVRGLTLDGRWLGEKLHGVYSRHRGIEQNNVYDDVNVRHFSGSGMKFDWVWVFAVRHSIIADNGEYGIDLDRGYDGWVIDNQISKNGKAGINAGPGMVCYTGNRIEMNGGSGMVCTDTQNINITGNCFDHNYGPAIRMKNARACTATGNISRNDGTVDDSDTSCAYLIEDSEGIAFSGNTAWCWPRKRDPFGREIPLAEGEAVPAPTKREPLYALVVKNSVDCAITGNALHDCGTVQVIKEEGNIRTDLSGNPGCLNRNKA